MNIKKKEEKCECNQCHKKNNGYRSIYIVTICGYHVHLCTECLLVLHEMIEKQYSNEFGHKELTEDDIRQEEKLRILLNKKLNGDWNDDCEEELRSFPLESMANSNKVIYQS